MRGSIPLRTANHGPYASTGRHPPCKRDTVGSIPTWSTNPWLHRRAVKPPHSHCGNPGFKSPWSYQSPLSARIPRGRGPRSRALAVSVRGRPRGPSTMPVNSPGGDGVCKTLGNANKSTVGSSPTTGTIQRSVAQPDSAPALGAGGRRFESGRSDHEDVAQSVERRVANADTPDHSRSSSPLASKAQMEEQRAFNPLAAGSYPAGGTKTMPVTGTSASEDLRHTGSKSRAAGSDQVRSHKPRVESRSTREPAPNRWIAQMARARVS